MPANAASSVPAVSNAPQSPAAQCVRHAHCTEPSRSSDRQVQDRHRRSHREVDRGTDDVPAEGMPMQCNRTSEGKMPVDEICDPLAPRRAVTANAGLDRLANQLFRAVLGGIGAHRVIYRYHASKRWPGWR